MDGLGVPVPTRLTKRDDAFSATVPVIVIENDEHVYRLQPFGGDLSEFETFGGFRLPTHVIGGNHYGTDLYHPFYRAKVGAVTFF